jgi:hypothetical protein
MTTVMAIIVGAFIGAPIGFFTCALLSINRRDDDLDRHSGTLLPSNNPGLRVVSSD